MIDVFRWAWGLLGLVLFASAALLYEDEEYRLRNKLVDWWVATSQLGEASVSRHVAITRALAGGTLNAINFVFGWPSISFQALWASLMLSSASFGLWVALYGHGLRSFAFGPEFLGFNAREFLIEAFGGLVLAFQPAIIRRIKSPRVRILMWLWAMFVGCGQIIAWAVERHGSVTWLRNMPYAYMISTGYDVSLVVVLRRVLKRATAANGFSVVVMLALLAMPLFIFGVPEGVLYFLTGGHGATLEGFEQIDGRWGEAGWAVLGGAIFSIPLNGFWVLISFSLAATAILLLCNMLFWAATQRTLHALHAKFPGRGYLVGAGAFCWLACATSLSDAAKHALGVPTQAATSTTVPVPQQTAPASAQTKPR